MKYLKLVKLLVSIIVISFFITSSVLAETSKEYAIMGKSTWAAFGCSSLASTTGNIKEQQRLFLFGYEEGLKFINALQTNKISRSDLSSELPLAMAWELQGPTPDFILGRVFEVAMEYALKNVYKTDNSAFDEDMQKLRAESEFSKRNCELIGK